MSIKISANKLAEFITAKTPARRRSIVRQLKRATTKSGHAPWYMAFGTPAKRFLSGGAANEAIILREIERMKSRTGKPWLNTDSAITSEAFKHLLKLAPDIRELDVKFSAPKLPKVKLEFGEVLVSATPDMIVRGERNGIPLMGGLRFYIAKESAYELGQRGAQLVAVMEHLWLTRVATGESSPEATLCLVLECFQQRVTPAPSDTRAHVAEIEKGCRDFSTLWHLLDGKEAA